MWLICELNVACMLLLCDLRSTQGFKNDLMRKVCSVGECVKALLSS